MKLIFFICVFILGLGSQLNSQTMVGLTKEEVRAAVKKDHKKFRKDDSVIKQRFNYLKYVNGNRTKTWIIYFNEQDICRTSKVVYDYSYLNEVQEDLNAKYRSTGELLWEYKNQSDTIQVELLKLEWYFSVRERKKISEE
jgi:hypothetical protein